MRVYLTVQVNYENLVAKRKMKSGISFKHVGLG